MSELTIYAILELMLSIHISLSNLLVLWVYFRYKHVRTATNTYIFSLALTDFLAGSLGIPLTVMSVLTLKPNSYYECLIVHLILCILCTVSTFHMLAIAFDKYITICCKDQLFETRHHRAIILIASSWIIGTAIAIMPVFNIFGFAETENDFIHHNMECHFTVVVDYGYLVYVIFVGTILAPTVFIIFCYVSIYSRIRKEEQQVRCLLPKTEQERRLQGRRKLIKILLILVVSYGICWYPLYIINTVEYFWPNSSMKDLTLWTVVLSHISCALNPLIYAYGMPGFKKALRNFFNIKSDNNNTYIGNHSQYMNSKRFDPLGSQHSRHTTSLKTSEESHLKARKISAPVTYNRRSTPIHHHQARKATLISIALAVI
ncbi:unnamed protein product [Auanema sp. JU1783]|nr:unnamed protein product [Auanema sp. JU1783]